MKIRQIKARQILNSRKEPAIEITINKDFIASAPSGASMGMNEVSTFGKYGLKHAIEFINKPGYLSGFSFEEFNDLGKLDNLIHDIGGNSVVALQSAILKAMSEWNVWHFLNPHAVKMPVPLGNVIGGGKHTKEKSSDIQEFLLMPSAKRFYDNAFVSSIIHKKVGKAISAVSMTDEGAWVPKMSNDEIFSFLSGYLADLNNTLNIKVSFGIDMAASSIWNGKAYSYHNFSKQKKKVVLSSEEQAKYVNGLIKEHGLSYVEDPMQEQDFDGFSKIKKSTLICGDDLVTTNLELLKQAIKHNSINCMIIKPNQIGSLIKTKEVVDFARKNGIATVISHRSGETMDATISDLAVAWEIPYIKCGIYGKERKAKLFRLAEIEEQIF